MAWMFGALLGGTVLHNATFLRGGGANGLQRRRCSDIGSRGGKGAAGRGGTRKLSDVLDGGDPWRPGWTAQRTVELHLQLHTI